MPHAVLFSKVEALQLLGFGAHGSKRTAVIDATNVFQQLSE